MLIVTCDHIAHLAFGPEGLVAETQAGIRLELPRATGVLVTCGTRCAVAEQGGLRSVLLPMTA